MELGTIVSGALTILKPIMLLLLKMWVAALCFAISTSVLLRCIFASPSKQSKDDKKSKQKSGRLGYASTDIHQRWTRP